MFWFSWCCNENDNDFERNEDRATVFLKWMDFRCSLKKHLKQLNNSVNFYYLKNNPGALHRQDTNRITNIKGLPYVSIDLEVGYLVSFTLMHHYTIILPLIVIDHSLLHSAVLCVVKHSGPEYEILFKNLYWKKVHRNYIQP